MVFMVCVRGSAIVCQPYLWIQYGVLFTNRRKEYIFVMVMPYFILIYFLNVNDNFVSEQIIQKRDTVTEGKSLVAIPSLIWKDLIKVWNFDNFIQPDFFLVITACISLYCSMFI